MRLFVALTPPESVVEDLDAFLDVRRSTTTKSGDRLRWSRPETFHLTLAFAGEADPSRLEDLEESLAGMASARAPFTASISGGGAFPDPARARVLYAGVPTSDDDGLAALARGARTAMATNGIEVDGGRFRPHVTLARLHQPANVVRWIELLDTYRSSVWTVDEIHLVESHLGGGGPRHQTLASFGLG